MIRHRPALDVLRAYQPGKPIEEVKRELGLTRVVKLASNENPLGPSPKALKALSAAHPTLNEYPEGSCYFLRQALSRRLDVPPDWLLFGNGSDEIILLAALAFLNPDDEIIMSDFGFVRYEQAAQAMGAKTIKIPMKNWRHDLRGFAAALSPKTKIVFFSNPNNPIGTMVGKTDVDALIRRVPDDVLIVMDHAYDEYVQSPDYPDALSYVRRRPNVVVLRTFSKAYGLAGLRVGYAVGRPEVLDVINRVRPPFNVNRAAQAAATAALDDKAHLRRTIQLNARERQFLYENYRRLGLTFVESAANFILVQMPIPAGEAFERLLREGVIVRPMAGAGLSHFVRISIGTRAENRILLAALRKILGGHSG
ncbi:MAG: histidinol-phosphate transaminase [Candidatus Sumerlaeia bacterium]